MPAAIDLNDTSPSIGEPRLVVTGLYPNPGPTVTIDSLHNIVSDLASHQAALVTYVARLEARITALESRTWWSMLKSQILSWFGK